MIIIWKKPSSPPHFLPVSQAVLCPDRRQGRHIGLCVSRLYRHCRSLPCVNHHDLFLGLTAFGPPAQGPPTSTPCLSSLTHCCMRLFLESGAQPTNTLPCNPPHLTPRLPLPILGRYSLGFPHLPPDFVIFLLHFCIISIMLSLIISLSSFTLF